MRVDCHTGGIDMAKRANGEGTIRKRPDGRWEGRYCDPITNRQHSVYANTRGAVRNKLRAELDRAIICPTSLKNEDLTVSGWLDIWLSRYVTNVKPLTISSYKTQCECHIKPMIGKRMLQSLTVDDIQIMYNQLFSGNSKVSGLSAKTIKNVHGVLHKALNQAVTNGYILTNPSNGCVLPRVVKKEIHPLSDSEIKKFLIAIEKDEFSDIFFVTLFTGMRQGEVLGLTWKDIDFEQNRIIIRQQLQRSRGGRADYFLGSLKNGKQRTITPAPYVMTILKQRKRKQDNDKLIEGNNWQGDSLSDDFVFTNSIGRHLVPVTVYKHYKAIVKRIGVPESRFHDLRHSYAVIALQNGDDVKTVQLTLGHHTAAFTLDVYGHVSEKMYQESAKRMENYIKNVNQNALNESWLGSN